MVDTHVIDDPIMFALNEQRKRFDQIEKDCGGPRTVHISRELLEPPSVLGSNYVVTFGSNHADFNSYWEAERFATEIAKDFGPISVDLNCCPTTPSQDVHLSDWWTITL